MKHWLLLATITIFGAAAASGAAQEKDNSPPPGFTALSNGKDLTGWQAMVEVVEDTKAKKSRRIPMWLQELDPAERLQKQKDGNDKILPHWTVKDGVLEYDGKGNSLQTVKHYGNFELYVDWKIMPKGDSGIYLRGQPQVQIWEESDKAAQRDGKFVGSGGLFNNQKNPKDPLVVADKAAGQWNTFWIKMVGDRVTIKLNGMLVVDNTPLENYWHRGQALPQRGPIELQHHGNKLWFKNVYVKELLD